MATSSAISNENSVKKIYLTVIEEVLANVREAFLDEGYDEQLLHELKHMWEMKLNASRAVQNSANDDNSNSNNSSNNTSNITSLITTASNNPQLHLPISHPQQRVSGNTNTMVTLNRNLQQTNRSSNNQFVNQSVAAIGTGVNFEHKYDPSTNAALSALPQSLFSQNQGHRDKKTMNGSQQLDGAGGGSSSDEDDDDDAIVGVSSVHGDDDEDDVEDDNQDELGDDKTHGDDYEGKEDPDPLNSDDDLTDRESNKSNEDLFDTEHVIVCQYDKITRIKNRWKFHLKDGIMNINGKDYLFSKANGDAEW